MVAISFGSRDWLIFHFSFWLGLLLAECSNGLFWVSILHSSWNSSILHICSRLPLLGLHGWSLSLCLFKPILEHLLLLDVFVLVLDVSSSLCRLASSLFCYWRMMPLLPLGLHFIFAAIIWIKTPTLRHLRLHILFFLALLHNTT